MHIKVTNGLPEKYTIGQLRRDNPQVSFPKTIHDDTLAEYGVYPCAETSKPPITYAGNVVEAFEKVNGAWVQTWVITNASADEIAQRNAGQWSVVREERNTLLAASDWTQVADAPGDQSQWAAYRQALRDLPAQFGSPWEIVWPTQPE